MGDAAPGLAGVDLQPNDDVTAERGADPLAEDAAAPERDRAPIGALQQRTDDLGLAGAEAILAMALERLGDRHPQLGFHQRVDLGRLQAGLAGGGQRRALARAHEADEHERRPQLPVTPRTSPMRALRARASGHSSRRRARTSSMWSPPNFSR